jgi:hypothetical protein
VGEFPVSWLVPRGVAAQVMKYPICANGHFKEAQQWLPPHLAETPRIVNMAIPQDDWSALGELAVPGDSRN